MIGLGLAPVPAALMLAGHLTVLPAPTAPCPWPDDGTGSHPSVCDCRGRGWVVPEVVGSRIPIGATPATDDELYSPLLMYGVCELGGRLWLLDLCDEQSWPLPVGEWVGDVHVDAAIPIVASTVDRPKEAVPYIVAAKQKLAMIWPEGTEHQYRLDHLDDLRDLFEWVPGGVALVVSDPRSSGRDGVPEPGWNTL